MASPAIRAVRDDEIGACVSLLHDAFADVAAEFGLTRDNCPTNAAFIAAEVLELDRERGCLQFAAEGEGMLTGFVELVPRPSGDLELRRLAVDPCERHVGLGHELVEFTRGAAAELGASRITIGIIEENATAPLVPRCRVHAHRNPPLPAPAVHRRLPGAANRPVAGGNCR